MLKIVMGRRGFLLILAVAPWLFLSGCSDSGYTPSYIISKQTEEEKVRENLPPK